MRYTNLYSDTGAIKFVTPVLLIKGSYGPKVQGSRQATKNDRHSDGTHGRSSVSGSGQKGRGTLARDWSNTTRTTLTSVHTT